MAATIVSVVAFARAGATFERRGLLGWLTILLDRALVVDGIAVRRTRDGAITLSYPSRTDRAGTRHHYIRPVDDDARQHLEREIFKALRGHLGEGSP